MHVVATDTCVAPAEPWPSSGANYENPYIGETDTGNDCSNTQPDPMAIVFKVRPVREGERGEDLVVWPLLLGSWCWCSRNGLLRVKSGQGLTLMACLVGCCR